MFGFTTKTILIHSCNVDRRSNDDDSTGRNCEQNPLEPIEGSRKHPLSWPTGAFPGWFFCAKYIFLLPILLPLSLTLPDVRLTKWRFLFPLTFIFSTLWMGLLSFGVSVGCLAGFHSLRWIRILNLGEFTHWAIPQLVVGIILARKGMHHFVYTFSILRSNIVHNADLLTHVLFRFF